jgi:hypothetical protein
MMKDSISQISLNRPATYQIQVPGMMDLSRAEWAANMEVVVDQEGEGPPITTLTGDLDQAALHGLLRRLYSLGLPLISVTCINGN